MENHVDYKNIMEYEIDESEEEDYNFNNKISDMTAKWFLKNSKK